MQNFSNSIEHICNFLRVSDRIGTAGQPTIAQYPAIVAAGYRVVINLESRQIPTSGACDWLDRATCLQRL